ncbi:MAG: (2Fe-2S)-binding protein [Planctomycetota bacterium]|jgi:bacterioferritin-associated ferredoxin
MHPDDHVCLCYRVSLRKLVNYMNRERPPVASQLSECLGAGTGCHWCVPYLQHLHRQWASGDVPALQDSPEQYAERRLAYHRSGKRED